jgi:hypothetical protein
MPTPDLSSPYWLVRQAPETVLHINRGRLFYSHYLRVLAARVAVEQTAPVLLLPTVKAEEASNGSR